MTEPRTPALPDSPERPCLVVGFDFSEAAELALDHALEMMSRLPGATLHVVWVRPTLADISEASRRLREHTASRVRFAANRLSPKSAYGDAQVQVHVVIGSAARVLQEIALREHADWIVLGARRRSGFEGITLGGVAADVLSMAPCPVVIACPRVVELRGADATPEGEPSAEEQTLADERRREGPRAEGPGAERPRAEGPGAEGSGAERPRAEGPGAEGSGAEGSGAEGSGAEGSGAEGSGAEGSGAEGSGAERPRAEGPGAEGPPKDHLPRENRP